MTQQTPSLTVRIRPSSLCLGASVRAFIPLALAVIFLLTGCGTVQEHRARQMRDWVAHWDNATQTRLGSATIQRGDTPAMIYVALGTPQWEDFTPGESTATWGYWGLPASESDTTIRFLSRSELRIPQPNEITQELVLTFIDGSLSTWQLRPVDPARRTPPRPGPMGTIPRAVYGLDKP